jgi:hypothetical protein
MKNAKSILGFNFDTSFFKNHGEIHDITKRQISIHIRKLERLQHNELNFYIDIDFQNKVLEKFSAYSSIVNKHEEYFSKKDIRILSYSINDSLGNNQPILNQTQNLNLLLELFSKNWSDNLILGLVSSLLNGWGTPELNNIKTLSEYIIVKLKNYQGSRKSILNIKGLTRYLSTNNGDFLLGADFVQNDLPIKESLSLLNLPESWISYPYFKNVFLTYYDLRISDLKNIIDEVEELLELRKDPEFNKIIIPKIIIQGAKTENTAFQDQIKRIAFNYIGDPEIEAKWYPVNNAPVGHQNEIHQAVQILNQWIIQQFINVFFEKCINDPRRKRFWLTYSKHMSQFCVIGNGPTKRTLLKDERISEFVNSRYKQTRMGDDSAIMFTLRNHTLVEFSDMGKLYAYKTLNPQAPKFTTNSYTSLSQLKIAYAANNQLIYRTGRTINSYSDEGSQPHSDGEMTWEEVFRKWISVNIGIL